MKISKPLSITLILGATIVILGTVAVITLNSDTQNQTPATQNTDTEPSTLLETVDSNVLLLDTSDWKIYRNEEYGFEMKYPSEYRSLITPTWGDSPPEQAQYTILMPLGYKDQPSLYLVRAVHNLEDAIIDGYRTTLSEFIGWIQNPKINKKVVKLSDGNRTTLVFFENRNPDGIGDARPALVVMAETEHVIVFITKLNTIKLDKELKAILSNLKFFEPLGGIRSARTSVQ